MPSMKAFQCFSIIKTFKTYHSSWVQKSEPVAANKSWLFIHVHFIQVFHLMTLMIVIRASPARLKGLWSHTRTGATFENTPSLRVSGICVTLHSTMDLFFWRPRCGVLRRAQADAPTRAHSGFTETSGASQWCHKWVCTQGCDTGALICMSTSCKSHTCKESKPAAMLKCINKVLTVPSDHVRAIVRAHLRYGSEPNARLFFFSYTRTWWEAILKGNYAFGLLCMLFS